jgi:hypothetical protein
MPSDRESSIDVRAIIPVRRNRERSIARHSPEPGIVSTIPYAE